MIINDYRMNGISVDKNNQGIRITYDGLLSKSGADTVYAFYGYGESWSNQSVQQMSRTINGFETIIPTSSNVNYINVAFKDSANNWDNNSYRNYSFVVDDITTQSYFT